MGSEEKRIAGEAAIKYVEDGAIVGVGTGSTVAFFIDALAGIKDRIQGVVSSSEQSTAQLKKHGIPVFDLNATGPLASFGLAKSLGYADQISNRVVDAIGDMSGGVRIQAEETQTGENGQS